MKCTLVCATLATLLLGLTLSASARDVVVPAGTLLQCTLNEPNFSPATAAVGDPVLCHLRGLTEFGQQAFPRGTYLVGHLEADKEPGHFVGKGFMKIQFDRIGLPGGDLPLDAKVIASRGFKVDREGDIRGKGHPKRDAVEWMLPPMWPEKLLTLPRRGPEPTMKGEAVLTLRLMDDVQLPQVAQGRAPLPPGWHYFDEPRSESIAPGTRRKGAPLPTRQVTPQSDEETAPIAGSALIRTDTDQLSLSATYASLVTKEIPAAPAPAVRTEMANEAGVSSPATPVFILKTGMVLQVGNYSYEQGRISYELVSGGNGVIGTEEIDWSSTTRANAAHGIRITLRNGRQNEGASGM